MTVPPLARGGCQLGSTCQRADLVPPSPADLPPTHLKDGIYSLHQSCCTMQGTVSRYCMEGASTKCQHPRLSPVSSDLLGFSFCFTTAGRRARLSSVHGSSMGRACGVFCWFSLPSHGEFLFFFPPGLGRRRNIAAVIASSCS